MRKNRFLIRGWANFQVLKYCAQVITKIAFGFRKTDKINFSDSNEMNTESKSKSEESAI